MQQLSINKYIRFVLLRLKFISLFISIVFLQTNLLDNILIKMASQYIIRDDICKHLKPAHI